MLYTFFFVVAYSFKIFVETSFFVISELMFKQFFLLRFEFIVICKKSKEVLVLQFSSFNTIINLTENKSFET